MKLLQFYLKQNIGRTEEKYMSKIICARTNMTMFIMRNESYIRTCQTPDVTFVRDLRAPLPL